jgi:hypothetical protein
MRQRRSDIGRSVTLSALVALATVLGPTRAHAQAEPSAQSALFLLLPVGARAVGMGNATTSASGTSDAVWWNPAGLATIRGRDASLHHSQSLIGADDAMTVAWGSSRLGVLAVSANLLDFGGEIPALDNTGVTVGKILSRNVALLGTYSLQVGSRLRTGISYKLVQFRFDCDGLCPTLPPTQASSYALDFGAQYDVAPRGRFPVTVGAVVRNLDVHLQSKRARSDALPTRLQIGAMSRYAFPKELAKDAEIRIAADLIDEFPLGRPLPRFGGEFIWEKRAFVRAGYVFESTSTESGGPTLGLGFVVSRLVIDFARVFTGLSADAGQAPTYLSLRLTF